MEFHLSAPEADRILDSRPWPRTNGGLVHGSGSARRRTPVRTSPPRADSTLRPRRGALPAVSPTARRRRSLTPPLRHRRVRGVPRMRAPRIRIPARQMRCLPAREAGGVQLQAPPDNPCIAQLSGFSLHACPRMRESGAGTVCEAHERDSLERLCRYIARPAVSNERLSINDCGQRSCIDSSTPFGTAPPMSCSTPSNSSTNPRGSMLQVSASSSWVHRSTDPKIDGLMRIAGM